MNITADEYNLLKKIAPKGIQIRINQNHKLYFLLFNENKVTLEPIKTKKTLADIVESAVIAELSQEEIKILINLLLKFIRE